VVQRSSGLIDIKCRPFGTFIAENGDITVGNGGGAVARGVAFASENINIGSFSNDIVMGKGVRDISLGVSAGTLAGWAPKKGTFSLIGEDDYLQNILIGWWKLDGNANDDSGNGNNGTVYGSPTWPSGQSGGQAFGQDHLTSPTKEFIDVGHNSSFDFSNGLSVEAWIKRGTTWNSSHGYNIVHKGECCSSAARSEFELTFRQNNSDKLGFEVMDAALVGGGCFGSWYCAELQVNDDQWHHVLGTWDGNTICLYILDLDQQDCRPAQISINIPTSSSYRDLTIGGLGISGKNIANDTEFEARIDDVKIYNRAIK